VTRRQPPARRQPSRLRPIDVTLLIALAAALAALATALLTRQAGPAAAPNQSPATSQRPSPSPSRSAVARPSQSLPPTAAAAAALVGGLQVGVASGQVSQDAAQDMFDRLRELLFIQPGEDNAQQQIDERYSQLVSAYDERAQRGEITGTATAALRRDLDVLGRALGAI
jgi:hypothetical protein